MNYINNINMSGQKVATSKEFLRYFLQSKNYFRFSKK